MRRGAYLLNLGPTGYTEAWELQRALAEQKGTNEKLGSILVRLNLISDEQLFAFLSKQYGIPAIQLSQLDIDGEVLKLVPSQIARKYEVLPIQRRANQLTLLVGPADQVRTRPFNFEAREYTGLELRARL